MVQNDDFSHIYQPNADNAELRERLKDIIAEKSFCSGEGIQLVSGRTSTCYFNTKTTVLDPEGAGLVAELILDALADVDADFIGGLEMGAVPIASAVAPASLFRDQPLRAYIVRKQAKGHGTDSLVEGLQADESFAGKRVVVVEDVTTTGGSAVKAADVVQAAGGEVVHIITVIDQQEGAAEMFREKGLPFTALFGAKEFL